MKKIKIKLVKSLCMSCNIGLGMLGDNVEGLSKALEYVRRGVS